MLKKKFLQSIFLIAAFVNTAVAQETNNLYFKHLTRQDGLAHNNVLDIKQDNKGFIWVLTGNGLQRYDGYRFQNTAEILHNPIFEKFDLGSIIIEKNYLWINKLQNVEKLDLVITAYILLMQSNYWFSMMPVLKNILIQLELYGKFLKTIF